MVVIFSQILQNFGVSRWYGIFCVRPSSSLPATKSFHHFSFLIFVDEQEAEFIINKQTNNKHGHLQHCLTRSIKAAVLLLL